MKLTHYQRPEDCPEQGVPECAVVIDVLRATTTMAAALAAGAEAIAVFADIRELLDSSADWPAAARLRAGERGGRRVASCDLGNSPLDCVAERVAGRRIFLSTTNGTRALQRVQASDNVLTASLTNRQAVVERLLAARHPEIWLLGSGWQGGFSLEDSLCAGAVADGLMEATGGTIAELAGNDEMIAAHALFGAWRDQLSAALRLASHGQRLLGLGCDEDLDYCALLDSVHVVPSQTEPGLLKAIR